MLKQIGWKRPDLSAFGVDLGNHCSKWKQTIVSGLFQHIQNLVIWLPLHFIEVDRI